ncbi:MAG: DUF1345 domain-containing protein [Sphingomonas adhaesiva]|uniref:DUF1345 domain-containing protein n=1 Tax=Sphingomonas adhaesiva TaxID=28212 RepID=UPI002FF76A43
MHEPHRWWGLGQRVAPPRFVLFMVVFAVSTAALWQMAGRGRAVMGGFDIAAAVFLIAVLSLFGRGTPQRMRRAAQANDANRALLLAISGAVSIVILLAVHDELKGKNDTVAIVLAIATLALAWLFTNMVYALHYAHLFYSPDDAGKDEGGIDFPGTDTPDYWDFLYFSYTLGMTFQTSDVSISDTRIRRIVTGQCLAAFVFNLGVIAFSINVLGGGN